MGTQVNAIGKHLALIGMMGAGKSTIGHEVAQAIRRPFVDTDAEIERRHGPIPAIFAERGEAEFRRLEEQCVAQALAGPDAVIALGGGAVLSERNRERVRARAFTVFLDVDLATAWERVRGSDRPLAQREEEFQQQWVRRHAVYLELGDAVAHDSETVLLRALGIAIPGGLLTMEPTAVIADERVLGLHPLELELPTLTVPPGEAAKTLAVVERLWSELALGRDGTIVALGGGSTTDVAGFVAATYLRGIRWVAVPTTLTGQVDAAIGGKTGINTASGKNLVGTFHFPDSVVIDPDVLATLPEEERRAGMAEVVKTGLLAGRSLWELPEEEMIRACASYKAAVVLSDPYEREGWRTVLNLGHTFAHALEAASGYTVRHGDTVALGLLAALRLSGRPTDPVEEILRPEPVRVDRERAWEALKRDKKAEGGRTRLVLLEGPGAPTFGVELPDAEVRAALDALIVD